MPIFNLFKYFSKKIELLLDKYFSENNSNKYLMLEEIRLRARKTNNIKISKYRKSIRVYSDNRRYNRNINEYMRKFNIFISKSNM